MKRVTAPFCATDSDVVLTIAAGGYDMTVLTVFLDVYQADVSPQPPTTSLATTVQANLTSPAAPTLGSMPGGFLPAQTIYVKQTILNETGGFLGETLASTESSLAVPANTLLTVATPSTENGATSYNVYAATASGAEVLQNASPIPIGTPWTMPTRGLVLPPSLPVLPGQLGALPPSTNTTSTTQYTLGATDFPVGGRWVWQLRVTDGSGKTLRSFEKVLVYIAPASA